MSDDACIEESYCQECCGPIPEQEMFKVKLRYCYFCLCKMHGMNRVHMHKLKQEVAYCVRKYKEDTGKDIHLHMAIGEEIDEDGG